MKKNFTRRHFIAALPLGTAAWKMTPGLRGKSIDERPALLGGKPVRSQSFPSWPVIGDNDRKTWAQVLESRKWNRGEYVERFEKTWADRLGTRYAVATASGTSALFTSLKVLGIGPGDEVIVPPYTFVATINVVLLHHALPIFVDTDRQTSQIDARKIEAALSERTRCIIPVHLGGSVAEMDAILEIARKHGVAVVEDACQAHLAEWRKRKAGTLGNLGCFSFQASKHLNSGEGGSIVSNDPELIEACMSFQNQGRPYALDSEGNVVPDADTSFRYARNGDNRRITEFQGALLLEQLTRLEKQAQTRENNARYLTEQLKEISGIQPARMYDGCTRNAYHLYMLRYEAEQFSGLPRARFIQALRAEGIPCSGGYSPLNREPFIREEIQSAAFRQIYSPKELAAWQERCHCPENDRLCEEAVWFSQTTLLANKRDMDQIAEAIRKIRQHAEALNP